MFSHLHLHTEYSLLSGTTRVKSAVARAKEFGMPALAITDYANLFGAVEFFVEAEKQGVKPIMGCEIFLPSYDDRKLKQYRRGQDFYWQLILLVQNEVGYKNLCRLISEANLDGFYYKPRADTALLKEFSEGLIALSSGFHSEINHHLMNENKAQAVEAAKKLAAIFPNRFYVELQDNGLTGQKATNQELISISKELGLPCVATNNIHYLDADDAAAFEVLRAIQIQRTISSPHDEDLYSTNEYYFKSSAEMMAQFDYCPEALKATQDIADSCNFGFTFGKYYLPKYETPANLTLEAYLEEQTRLGFEDRWPKLKKAAHLTDDDKARYLDRLAIEIKVINNMGFAGYFLIVSDFILWAKANGVPVGPGRGSGAGSIVAYCLSITELDPLRYNLLFERFLNPERISMPDFDIDFCQDNRQRVIDYVQKKYGNVSQIITFGKMKAKAVIRDVGRVMGLEYGFVDNIAKLIPNVLNITLADALKQEQDLQTMYNKDETVHKLMDTSLKLEGLSRHASVHAAGVIISDKPLWNFAPLYRGSNEDVVLQFDMKSVEKIGLIKFDFLGLKTLTVIQKAIVNIKKSKNINVDISDIPIDDKAVYDMLSKGDGCGIFQLESSGMRDLMERLQPNCFEDIVALVALFRPGPLGSGMVDDFIERKKGLRPITYELPELKKILDETYGVIVYQEQVMQIASLLANYSLGEADILRRAMGKKKAEEMDAQRKRFMDGAAKNQINTEKAGRIFDLMALFAEYGFNKSHSAAYALISYQTAWLKTHYPTEYMAALMSTEMQDTDKILEFITDCKQHHIQLLTPDINSSEVEFAVAGEGKIRYALGCLKGVGEAAVESIQEARKNGPFASLYDFCSRVDLRRVSKKVVEVLTKSGGFDCFKISRKALWDASENIAGAAAITQKNLEMGQSDLFSGLDAGSAAPIGLTIKTDDEWSQKEMLEFEKEVFGFYFSGHPLQVFADSLTKLVTHNTLQLKDLPQDTTVLLGGTVRTQKTIFTKKGDKMAFVQLEDLLGSVEVIVFSRAYKEYGSFLALDEPIIIKGTVDRKDDQVKVLAETIEKLTDKLKQTTRNIRIHIPYESLTPQRMQRIVEIVGQYQGQSVVSLHLKKQNGFEAVIELPPELRATACEPLQHHLNRLFEDKVVRFI